MLDGISSGILWGLDTIILGFVLSLPSLTCTKQTIFLAPFISTFLHDSFSCLWISIYMYFKGELWDTLKKVKTRSGHFIIFGSLLGAPIGMTGYILAIKYIGPGYTAIISSLYPAIGALLSYIFLKEKMNPLGIFGLILSILGIIILGYTPVTGYPKSFLLGFTFALVCVLGWASEATICAYGMHNNEVSPEQSLQLRQLTSSITYGFLLIFLLKGVRTTISISLIQASIILLATSFLGTLSYLCYYRAIYKIGATKAMSLNITYPVWAIIFGFILLNEPLSFKSISSSIIIMTGSILAGSNINQLFSNTLFQTKKEIKK